MIFSALPEASRSALLAMTSSIAGVSAEGVRSMFANLALINAVLEQGSQFLISSKKIVV